MEKPEIELAISDQKETIRDLKRAIKYEDDPDVVSEYRYLLKKNKRQLNSLYRLNLKLKKAIFKASL